MAKMNAPRASHPAPRSRNRALVLALAGAAALAGCAEVQSAFQPPPAEPVVITRGTLPIDADEAGTSFRQVCGHNAPGFAGAGDGAGKLGFVEEAGTGTWFHTEKAISFRIEPARCIMEFRSAEIPAELASNMVVYMSPGTIDVGSVKTPAPGAARATGPRDTRFEIDPFDQVPLDTHTRPALRYRAALITTPAG